MRTTCRNSISGLTTTRVDKLPSITEAEQSVRGEADGRSHDAANDTFIEHGLKRPFLNSLASRDGR